MLARFRSSLTYANVMATVAVFLALGGGALAATSLVGSDGTIRGCVGKTGQLTVLKPGKKCVKGTRAISWNQVGPTGATGQPGAACLSSDPNCRGPKGDACLSSDPNCKGPKGDACLSSDPNCKGPKGDACLSSDPNCKGPKGDTGPSTGPAGGDLTGNYPTPTIKAKAVTNDKLLRPMCGMRVDGDGSLLYNSCQDAVVARISGTHGVYCFALPFVALSATVSMDYSDTGHPVGYSTVDTTTAAGICPSGYTDAAVTTYAQASGSVTADERFSVFILGTHR